MPDVTTIQPNSTVEKSLEQNELTAEIDDVRVLGFPKHLFEFDVEIERKLLENRETTMSVTVDLLTGTSMKNDMYPSLESRSFTATSLLNPRVDRSTAAETAHSIVRRRVNNWYKTYKTPQITIARDDQVFKLFWVVPSTTASTVTLIDTITGEVSAQDIQLEDAAHVENTSQLG
ncbi:hypothetical protein [Haladaptatus sp. NG-SE-30]